LSFTTYILKRFCTISESSDKTLVPRIRTPQSSKTKVISGKKKSKFYDDNGNEVNDEPLLRNILQGVKVIVYHEDIQGEEYHVVRK